MEDVQEWYVHSQGENMNKDWGTTLTNTILDYTYTVWKYYNLKIHRKISKRNTKKKHQQHTIENYSKTKAAKRVEIN